MATQDVPAKIVYSKIQQVSNTDKVLGRLTAGAGDIEEIDCTAEGRSIINYGCGAVCEGRLTLTTSVPITVSDVTAATHLYWTPYKGNRIALFNGTKWVIRTFAEIDSGVLSLTNAKNYDVFLYDNAGTVMMELLVWTDDTNRATALVLQGGVFVKSGVTTRRYVGTIRASATNNTEDSEAKRFVWNYYNRVKRSLKVIETTDSWEYHTGTWRSANNSAANRVQVVIGVAEILIELVVVVIIANSTAVNMFVGICIDNTNANDASLKGYLVGATGPQLLSSYLKSYIAVGYHYYQWTEKGTSGTQNWFGDAGAATDYQSGMIGTLEG